MDLSYHPNLLKKFSPTLSKNQSMNLCIESYKSIKYSSRLDKEEKDSIIPMMVIMCVLKKSLLNKDKKNTIQHLDI